MTNHRKIILIEKLFHYTIMIKTALLFIAFLHGMLCFSQSKVIEGKVINLNDGLPVPQSRIIVNKKYVYFSDSLGYFKININAKSISQLDILVIGFNKLSVKITPNLDSFYIDLIVIVPNVAGDYFFVTINERRRKLKYKDRIEIKKIRGEIKVQASLGYISWQNRIYKSRNGLVKLK